MAEAKYTIMYSVEPNGHVAVHKFPYDASDPLGMTKLQKFVNRGFTFEDPRRQRTGLIQVIEQKIEVTREEEVLPIQEEPVQKGEDILPVQKGPELPFLCLECGKGPFKSAFGLRLHQRVHKK